GSRIDVHDGDPSVGVESLDQPLSEVAGHVLDVERFDRERRVEVVTPCGPLVERWREQNEKTAAIDRADGAPERVRTTLVVAIENYTLAGGPEERIGAFRSDAFAVQVGCFAGRNERRRRSSNVGSSERRACLGNAGVTVAGEHE